MARGWSSVRISSGVTLTCQPFAAGARSRGGRLNGPCRADGFDRGDT
jgi:endonuclease YncB( thermonuclease family)